MGWITVCEERISVYILMMNDKGFSHAIRCHRRGREVSLATVIMEVTGNTCDITYEAVREGDIHRSLADTGRLEETLGRVAECSIADGLAQTIAWSRAAQNGQSE